MRCILFRGKVEYLNKWAYGDLEQSEGCPPNNIYIAHYYPTPPTQEDPCGGFVERQSDKVMPETVGQYTGLNDKNGNKIFEGDIVKLSNSTVVVSWENGGLGYISKGWGDFISFAGHNHLKSILSYIEVIGNIHDNPELVDVNE